MKMENRIRPINQHGWKFNFSIDKNVKQILYRNLLVSEYCLTRPAKRPVAYCMSKLFAFKSRLNRDWADVS
jgi:hypothetical protein